jgi:predicted kinase
MKGEMTMFLPKAPEFRIEWDEIYERYDWMRAMEGVPQNPIYHAEGDVLIHTKLVCEALVCMKEWQQLDENDRSVLFAAALLHDVAKPYCTKEEPEGIVSPGHAVRGEMIARKILYTELIGTLKVPFSIRESIVKLVRFHGLPLFFMEKPNPAKAVIGSSQMVRMDWLSILAKADILGRTCPDAKELLERVGLFSAFCEEQGCLLGPKDFPNSYSRFVYFQKENGYPAFEAYDDTKSEVILMSGLPASGKDTWIEKNYAGYPVISLDVIREEHEISPKEEQGHVVFEARERAKTYLRKSESFVWNATNLSRSLRKQLIQMFTSYGAKVTIIYMEAPYKEILKRNKERPRYVPENVIDRMITKLEVPDVTEAHEVRWICK